MAVARTADSAFDHKKRWLLEARLARAGAVWGDARRRGPMSGLECCQRVWGHLDGLGRKHGELDGLTPEDVEVVAGWNGEPGAFWGALLAIGWVDDLGGGSFRWHDFHHLNERAITARENGRKGGRPRKPVPEPVEEPSAKPSGPATPQPIRDVRPASGNPAEHGGRALRLTPSALAATLDERTGNPSPNPSPNPSGNRSGFWVPEKTEKRTEDSPVGGVSSGPRPDAPKAPRPKPAPGADAVLLAGELLTAIQRHTPTFRPPPRLEGWARPIDLALRLDGRTVADLRRAIAFAHADPAGSFWRPNLLSGEALRRQADRLLMQADRAGRDPRGAGLAPRELEGLEAKLRERGA